jgi:DNA-binding HxlR family transcriptional regulator
MSSTRRRSDCPINFALEIFGDRWSLLIVRDLMFKGKVHYGEFMESEERIATNILADRLQTLEKAGIVEKRQDPRKRSKNVYTLTEKGWDLLPALTELVLWSAKHDPDTAADPDFVAQAQMDRAALYASILRGQSSRTTGGSR